MRFLSYILTHLTFSAKNIQEKADWAVEEKPGMDGQDPFAVRKQEKNLEVAKQKKRELKNIQNSLDPKGLRRTEKTPLVKDKKLKRQLAEKTRLQNEKSALDKTLEKGKIFIKYLMIISPISSKIYRVFR